MIEREPETPEELGHEPITVDARGVSITAAMLLGTVVAALVLMGALNAYLASVHGGKAQVAPRDAPAMPPPGVPAVNANQRGTLRELRERETALLTGYGWIDRDAGVARIPIDRAMEIQASQRPPTPELPDEDMAAQ